MGVRKIQSHLRQMSDKMHAAKAARYVKTGKGEYGEGYQFLGIKVPDLRRYARQCSDLPLADITRLMRSRYHEERLFAVFLLVQLFQRSDEEQRDIIYQTYLVNTHYFNGWDLVDSSAYHIVGPHLENKKRSQLVALAKSDCLWERRISIIATLHFIRLKQYADTLKLARILLKDEQDLIHKAVGWMLREVGIRDLATEVEFLDKHYADMPRTMLRYAIEKFDPEQRRAYLSGSR